ncbi:oligopeptide transport system substrate-binding protein [Caloramator fervidus]|uniref:Oligopeptide transport system substrate-binding protein n=1 Tax=Caloramator fervidus TaxID=29344 RepID=A0A1H5VAI8_9CLOT|nr:ABC transporter substrate-binding protein [Caloramator fervidus]SEF84230.1 oligopeptide transport system substrate-binding protein [Caloramator fervidus]
MKKSKLFIVLALVLAIGVSFFSGCAKGGQTGQTIKYNLGAEPATIDPQLNSAVDGATVIVNCFDGLTRLDANDKPIPAVAERWEISPDQLTYKFYLRKDAKWTDGQPVKAQDFVYAWQRAVDPKTAAEYAYQLWYIKNGEAISEGKMPVDQLGVKALDDYTLEVTLEGPTPYFLSLTAFPTYMPVRKDVVEKDPQGWATKPETYITNGPFKLKEWRPKDALILEKNPNWYNADKVKLQTIEMKMLEDQTSALAAFRTGQLDYIESPPSAEIPNLLKSGEAKVFPYLGTYFYIFNLSPNAEKVDPAAAKAIKDVRVRKAINLAINRKAIVENVTKGGQIPATSFVPNGIPDADGKDFKKKDYFPAEGNVEEAKKLLAEAGYPDGKGFPKITLIYNTSQGHQAIAMAIQDMLKKNLGINIELANQEWKVFQKTRDERNYIFARHGWIADYVDPMTFLDMWVSNSGQNNIGYNNPEYDKKIAAAKKEADPAKRMQLLHEAEDILMNDMPLVPLYYYTNIACVKDYVKDVHKSVLGFVYFENAYIQK